MKYILILLLFMRNIRSIESVNASVFDTHFRKPLFNSYSYARIPGTIQQLFGLESTYSLPADTTESLQNTYDKIIVFFVDGLGWDYFEKFSPTVPMLKQLDVDGITSKITSEFPSTTSAHLTTMHTGTPVATHGIYEWYYYEPKVDRIISPLLYSYAGDNGRDTLLPDIQPKELFPDNNIYEMLQQYGISSKIYQNSGYTPSPYISTVSGTAELRPFESIRDGLKQLATDVLSDEGQQYYFFYCDSIDKASHHDGPSSEELAQAMQEYYAELQEYFVDPVKGLVKKTLMVQISDHGHEAISPETTVYINKEIPTIDSYIKQNAQGEPLLFAGSALDVFLYIQEEKIDEFISIAQETLTGKAMVYKTADLIEQGIFGDIAVSEHLHSRLGNVVIIPYDGNSVYWYEEGVYQQNHHSMHGGLTPTVMDTPLTFMEL